MKKTFFTTPYMQHLINAIIISFSILLYSLILLNHSPNFLRTISGFVRNSITLLVPIMFLVLIVVFHIQGYIGKFLALSTTLSFFSLALAGAWALGVTESGILSGVVPMFDSSTYYIDGFRLLLGEDFSMTSSRRPIFSAFFAVLLYLSKHNLLVALSLLNLLVALSCFILAREIQKTHGTGSAVFVLLIVFMYYRFHSGAVRTESLGVALSMLGTAFAWRSINRSQRGLALTGIFLLAIAMLARAGAFFSLPMVILWGGVLFRPRGKKISWSFIISGIGVVAAAFFINQLITNTFGTRETVPFGNFSYSFYGLASGGQSWAYVLSQYPDATPMEIYQRAFHLILENPALIIQGALYNWKMFFSNTGYGMFSFMLGESVIISTIFYVGLCLLCLFSLTTWFRKLFDPYLSFIGFSVFGLLLSVPFLPPTDTFRVRAYAASIVLIGLLPAMSIHTISKRLNIALLWKVNESTTNGPASTWFSFLFLGAVLLGPFILYGAEQPPKLQPSVCPERTESLIVRYDPGTMIHLVPQTTIALDWAPNYKIGNFRRNTHDFPNIPFAEWARQIKPGSSLFYSLDFRTQEQSLVVINTDLLPDPPALLEVCGMWVTEPEISGFQIFEASSASSYATK